MTFTIRQRQRGPNEDRYAVIFILLVAAVLVWAKS